MKLIGKVLLTVVLLIILLFAGVYIFQDKFFFHQDKLDANFQFDASLGGQELFIKTQDGETINALFYDVTSTLEEKYVVLYFHGNGGTLDHWQSISQRFIKMGFSVLMIDYRGYGKSTGSVSEKGVYLDGQAAYDYLISKGYPATNIVAYGMSMGTGIACHIAANNKVNSLILEAPFTGLKRIAEEKAPFLFPQYYVKYNMDNLQQITLINCPLMIIHGTDDGTVPFAHGQQLYNAYKNSIKENIWVVGAGHGNLWDYKEVPERVQHFILSYNTGGSIDQLIPD